MVEGLSIVVPCYNEASRGNFEKRVETVRFYMSLLKMPSEVIFVTDGCTDNTAEIIRKCGFLPYTHKKNRGKGYALKHGLQICRYDTVLIMDADLSVSLDYIPEFYEKCKKNTIVIGTRKYNKRKRNRLREAISKISKLSYRYLLGLNVEDSQCGFKMFRLHDYNKVSKYIISRKWLLDMELLIYLKALGVEIIEIPVRWENDENSTLKSGEALKSSIVELLKILKVKHRNIKRIQLKV